MPNTDAATGKAGSPAQGELSAKSTEGLNFISAEEHYDLLIAEGNDPVLDPPALADYMNGWDGDALFEALCLRPDSRVLEIGVGTGRLALRALNRGIGSFTGIDLSEATLSAARAHLAVYPVSFIWGEFPQDAPSGPFDRIYSSLTFLHIEDKRGACEKIASLLAPGGRCVISLDKEQSGVLDMGSRRVRTYPDSPQEIERLFRQAGLCVFPGVELERAHLVIAERPAQKC